MKIIFDSGLEMSVPKDRQQLIIDTVMNLPLSVPTQKTISPALAKPYVPRNTVRTWKLWKEHEDREMLNLKSLGMTNKQIGKKLDRTGQAISVRLSVLKKRGAEGTEVPKVHTPTLDRIARVTAESQE